MHSAPVPPGTQIRRFDGERMMNHRCSAALGLLLEIACSGCGGKIRGPYLTADRTSHEFTAAGPADDRAEFTLTNAGNEILDITDIQSSCGCAVAQMPVTRLAPGESTTLGVRVAPPPIGSRSATVAVFTNSPATPATEFTLLAKALNNRDRVAQVVPRRVDVQATKGESAETSITIHTFESSPEPFVKALRSDLPFVAAHLVAVSDTAQFDGGHVQRKYVWRLTIDPAAPHGAFSGALRIVTSAGEDAVAAVHFDGVVLDKIFAEPATVFVACSKDSQPKSESAAVTVVLRSTSDRPWRINSLAVDTPWLEVEELNSSAKGTTAGEQKSLVVRLSGRPDSLPARAQVTIGIDTSDVPQVQIPVTVVSSE